MNDYSELKRLAVATEVMYAAANWSWPETVADARLGKTTTAYALVASPDVVAGLVTERDHLANEVQRVTELRRLEWNRAEGLQAKVNDLNKKLAQLKRAEAEQGSPQ